MTSPEDLEPWDLGKGGVLGVPGGEGGPAGRCKLLDKEGTSKHNLAGFPSNGDFEFSQKITAQDGACHFGLQKMCEVKSFH